MELSDLKNELDLELDTLLSSNFKLEIKDTDVVPSIDDPDITFPNLETGVQKCKRIETCVLYIDLRKSTDMNLKYDPEIIAKLYSSLIRSMSKAAKFFNGKVRNIVGDRLMVLFNRSNCFQDSINTAILMSSITKYMINQKFVHADIKCGIGIDFGNMLVSKNGIIKQGKENPSNKSLVWLGKPANIASKLTDLANKQFSNSIEIRDVKVRYANQYTFDNQDGLNWMTQSVNEFRESLITTYEVRESNKLKESKYQPFYTPIYKHKYDFFKDFYFIHDSHTKTNNYSSPEILVSESVFHGLKLENPEHNAIKKGLLTVQPSSFIKINGFSEKIYGCNMFYPVIKDN